MAVNYTQITFTVDNHPIQSVNVVCLSSAL